ncbi:MAG: GNAT family N-acetyltransferase [Cyanobacteria bacterium SBLK]|nr:GNAT family N-acetyltransferase [Cyanobacteria bacterium SBLK]
MNILFVCSGNTCRSPMAEALFRERIEGKGIEVRSAGTTAFNGDPVATHAMTILQKKGIEYSHQSQRLNPELMNWADFAFTMTQSQQYMTLAMFPQFASKVFLLKEYIRERINLDIIDPFGENLEIYQRCTDELERCLTDLQDYFYLLETPRLILRKLRANDRDALTRVLGDPEVMQFSVNGTLTEAEIEEFICDRVFSAYDRKGFSFYGVVEKTQQQLIGICGLLAQKIGDRDEIEIGYRLAREYWGRGLATEAATAVRDYGFNKFHFKRLISIIESDNIRSIRVSEKIGMTYEKDTLFHSIPVRIYSLHTV